MTVLTFPAQMDLFPTRSNHCNQLRSPETGAFIGHLSDKEKRDSRRKAIRKSNKKRRIKAREWHLMNRFGLTLEGFDRILIAQGGGCAICGFREPPPRKSHKKNRKSILHVDHDHDTGKVRGILCFNCNSAIGHFRDDEKLVEKALDYLRRTK